MDKEIDRKQLRRERRRKVLAGAGVAVVAVGALVWLLSGMAGSVNPNDLTVSTVDEGPLEVTVSATGRIAPAHE